MKRLNNCFFLFLISLTAFGQNCNFNAPIAIANDITIYLDAVGYIILEGEDVNNESVVFGNQNGENYITSYDLSNTVFACKSSGDTLGIGTHTVQFSVTDYCGKSDTADIKVTVIGYEWPTIESSSTEICAGENVTLASSDIGLISKQIGSTTSFSSYLYGTSNGNNSKVQILIEAEDLEEDGIVAGNLNSISFNVTQILTAGSTGEFTLSMMQTSDDEFETNTIANNSRNFFDTDFTEVYSVSSYTPSLGTNEHFFNTPFYWDGESNIVIQICQASNSSGFLTRSRIQFIQSMCQSNISGTDCNTSAGTRSFRPLISLGQASFNFNWNPGNASTSEITVSPSSTTSYILNVTNTFGCTSADTVEITLLPTPAIAFTENNISGFNQGVAVLISSSVSGGSSFDYTWSTDDETEEIEVSTDGVYTLTATNEFGCSAEDSIEIEIDREELLSAYTIIATDMVEFNDESTLKSGGMTALGSNGEINIDDDSEVSGSSTFAKADEIDVKSGGVVDTKIEETNNLQLPTFQNNYLSSSSSNITIGSYQTVTLTDSVYGKIQIGKNSIVTFSQPVIYIEGLKTSDDVTIEFSQSCVKLLVEDKVELKKNNTFNSDEKSVVIFVEDNFKMDKNSSAITSVYSLKKIDINGHSNGKNAMTGMFIAKEVQSTYTDWNANMNRSDCQQVLNKKSAPSPTVEENAFLSTTQVQLNAYPNPTSGNFGMDVFNVNEGTIAISVYDMLGREVKNTGTQNISGPSHYSFDLTGNVAGQYFVRTTINGEVYTNKIILVN